MPDYYEQDTGAAPKRVDQLDDKARHLRRMDWFRAEKYRQYANREERALCERMYDSKQWTPEEKAELERRGQIAVVFNEVKPQTDWLIGTERRTRIDFTVTPRNAADEAAMQDAETKKHMLKAIDDDSGAGYERSYAFDDMVKSGLGWMEVGARGDATDLPVYVRSEPWRNMWHDSFGPRRDLRDSRYVFRYKVLDLDIALAFFAGKEKELLKVRQGNTGLSSMLGFNGTPGSGLGSDTMPTGDEALEMHVIAPLDWYNPRERVALLECWSLEPWIGGPKSRKKTSSTYDMAPLRMRCAIMTEYDTLYEDWSPYEHNRFPFIPLWAYRDKATLLPYSPIWPLISKQRALNHAMSRGVWEISVNQAVIEAGAYNPELMNIEEIQTELSAPDGVVVLASGGLSKFRDRRGADNANAQMMIADRMAMSIRNESGITAENMGRESAVTSGVGIGKKQDQGALATTELFDNHLMARQMEGELTLSVAEQYMDQPTVITVPGERSQYASHQLNQPQPDGTILNDITARRAKFVIGEQAWKANLAQAAFEQMIDLLSKLAPVAPQVVINMLDLVFEYADLPNKATILQRIRAVTGQPGPDGKLTPEQQQAQQQKSQQAQMQFQAQMAQLKADIDKATAQGSQLNAAAMKTRLEALYIAAEAAQVLTLDPAIAPVADTLAASAGYQEQQGDQPLPLPVQTQAAPAQMAQQGAPGGNPNPPMPAAGAGPLVGHEAGMNTNRADGVIQG